MEERQERLCIRILQTLRAMMAVDPDYGEKVRKVARILPERLLAF